MTPASGPRGRIALALGGGAALGWTHIGVLRVLADQGIEVGALAGTSAGALVAACHAANRLDALEAFTRETTRRTVWRNLGPHWRRGAWLGGRRIARELEHHLGGLRIEALATPLALVGADLATAAEVRLTHGPLVPAVQASMAIPGVFPPVTIEGRRLVDGGMVATVPIAAAHALAPDLPLVAVDVLGDLASALPTAEARPSSLAMLGAGFLMLVTAQTRQAIAACPPLVTLRPRVGHIGTGGFTRADELIAAGRAAAMAALPTILAAMPARA